MADLFSGAVIGAVLGEFVKHANIKIENVIRKNVSIEIETLEKGLLRRYEVFLSFRGVDTLASFISHLYASLVNHGINVFRDDDSLKRGNHISASLLQAIEQSQMSVVVFSKNYANSRWCLNELVKIMECRRTIGQIVLPVFYDVDASEVRHQTGEFGKAFQSLLSRISKKNNAASKKWRNALREASGLAGFVLLNSR